MEDLPDASTARRFESVVLPHLSAAYNLARWLTRNAHDAEDVVQDATLRAFRAFHGFRGGDPRAWLLTIVRNTCYTWLRRNRPLDISIEAPGRSSEAEALRDEGPDPETLFLREADAERLRRAIVELPVAFREVLVLRELEGLSYKEIAGIVDVPLGTVMSRLSRAREQMQDRLRQTTPGRGEQG